jgi:hypothetical protein
MNKSKKSKPKGYAPTLSEFMRTAIYSDVYTAYGELDTHIASLKYYQDRDFNTVIYKTNDGRGWNIVVFQCAHDEMESLYSTVAVNVVSQMLVRNTIWMGKEKPHFPIKGRPAIIFAWSKLGRQVHFHEMSEYPNQVEMVRQLITSFNLRVS